MRSWIFMFGLASCFLACDTSASGDSLTLSGGGPDVQSMEDQFASPSDATITPMVPTGPRMAYIAIGHRFSDEIGVPGQGISVFSVTEAGALSESAIRLEAPHPVSAIGFAGATGRFFVASERGAISMYDVRGTRPTLQSSNQLDVAGIVAVIGGESDPCMSVLNE